ncbi:hypothetical protein M441DRAFT_90639 [Trichoderma asperellum CBS 433.97]|uniref:Uncharacterized protein n=1 Tax=Trichoderma asperellum (strain ATCC 204424 / CBS 433.97 / NBRC 101777) TaxID=1042311 RepID=A0A2T3Z6G5_TRIA4|nr:hypothetical protein M441DRAFT_90639 [Trichoderma asperellum CBS 433.97]PTB40398.1 hypothetical protein M441DRAFT_90639 [Trichoderma asperellum CBS 433.97]
MTSIDVELDTINMESVTDVQREYTTQEKAKARKSGPSLISKTMALGMKARVFAMHLFFDPTHRVLKGTAHVPAGETPPPNLQEMIAKLLSDATSKRKDRKRRERRLRQFRLSAQMGAKRTQQSSQQVGGLQTSDDISVDDASDESESDSAESEKHNSSPITETSVNQQQESGDTTKHIVNQIPDSSNSAQDCAQPSQVSGFTNDNRAQDWVSIDLGGCDGIEDNNTTSWAGFEDFENLFSEEGANVKRGNGPTEVAKLPLLGQQVLPYRPNPRRAHIVDQRLHKVTQAGKVDSLPHFKQGNAAELHRSMQKRRMIRNCLLAVIKGIDKCNANNAIGRYRADAPYNRFT